MKRKTCFVKLSGDTFLLEEVLDWIVELSRQYLMVICVGGGSQINQTFAEWGLKLGKHGPLGREDLDFHESQLARDVLEQNRAKVQDRLASKGVTASVVIPVLDIGGMLCHVNGDQFTLAAYHGFDVLYVATTSNRVEDKKGFFAPYEKIQVVGFSA